MFVEMTSQLCSLSLTLSQPKPHLDDKCAHNLSEIHLNNLIHSRSRFAEPNRFYTHLTITPVSLQRLHPPLATFPVGCDFCCVTLPASARTPISPPKQCVMCHVCVYACGCVCVTSDGGELGLNSQIEWQHPSRSTSLYKCANYVKFQ